MGSNGWTKRIVLLIFLILADFMFSALVLAIKIINRTNVIS